MNNVSGTKYILGHSPAEIQRLMSQAVTLRPITERLLRSAGIEPGMRVLDIGCGAGDVSMLAAELVGSTGSVSALIAMRKSLLLLENALRWPSLDKSTSRKPRLRLFPTPSRSISWSAGMS